VSSADAFPLLDKVFQKMFEFTSLLSDEEICLGIEVRIRVRFKFRFRVIRLRVIVRVRVMVRVRYCCWHNLMIGSISRCEGRGRSMVLHRNKF
jgi:hypothetical protein